MGESSAPKLKRYLPHVLIATILVIAAPVALVSRLAGAGLVGSVLVSGPLAMLMSLAVSSAGSAWWKKRPNSHDLVFSDLMVWGWLRRLRTERRLSRAVELLGSGRQLAPEQEVEQFEALASALEARDPYTHGHTRRVTRHSAAIAQRMGLPPDQVIKVRTAAAIHDIGKLHTPREVLNKPGRLTDQEFAVIKKHPVDGAQMAQRLGDEEITAMVLHHHERLDGTGYPSRLVGEQIPLGARIIAVADTFDAITSTRAYRRASSHKKALAILTKEAGTKLDAEAVRAFRSHYSGRRGVALGSLLTSAPGRLLPWRWSSVSSAPVTKGVAALALLGTLGGSAAEVANSPTHARGRPAAFKARRATRANASRDPKPALSVAAAAVRHRALGAVPAKSGHPRSAPAPGSSTSGTNGGRSTAGASTPPRVPAAAPAELGGAPSPSAGSHSSGAVPSLPTGTPSLPTGAPSLPSSVSSLPARIPSPPTKTPPLPTGTPAVPTSTPPLPGGTPALPTSTPSPPGGTPTVPK